MKIRWAIAVLSGLATVSISCRNTELNGQLDLIHGGSEKPEAATENDYDWGQAARETDDLKYPGWIGRRIKEMFLDRFGEAPLPENDLGYSGSGGVPPPSLFEGIDGLLWIPCDETSDRDVQFRTEIEGNKELKIRVSGQWCPEIKEQTLPVSIVFVIDRSGSMVGGPQGGNDPTMNGSCGRHRSAQIIYERLKRVRTLDIKVGVISFGSRAQVRLPLTSITQWSSGPAAEMFCGSDGMGATTNYESALTTAQRTLAQVQGKKIVIFVSDGAPTVHDGIASQPAAVQNFSTAISRGLQAATNLRKLDQLSLFAFYVAMKGSDYSMGTTPFDPKNYLGQITGDPSKVKITQNADELAQATAQMGLPLNAISITESKGSIVSGGVERPVRMEKIIEDPEKPEVFFWYSEPFSLPQQEATPHVFRVEAMTTKNFTLTTTAEILTPIKQK